MTRLYLESVAASSSSIGGLVMPIGLATVPDNGGSLKRRSDLHQGYQPVGRRLEIVVDHHDVELVLRGHLDPGQVEPSPHALGVLRAAPGEPASQLVERRWCEEHEAGVRHRLTHQSGAPQLDLQQGGDTRRPPLPDRQLRRAVAVAGVRRVLEQLAGRDHPLELAGRHEVVLDAITLTRPRGPGRDTDREPDLRMTATYDGDQAALADTGRAGQDREDATRHVAPNSRASASRCFAPSPRTRRD